MNPSLKIVGAQRSPDEARTPVLQLARALHRRFTLIRGAGRAKAMPEHVEHTPPFVRIGDRVTPTTVVGLIEAMKLFNEVTADCSGVIEEVVAQNQQAVEFGEVLFRVNPASA